MNPFKLSVILPAYNEGRQVATSIGDTALALAGCPYEVIVVDDGSTDDTLAQAQAAANDPCIKIVHHEPNRGKGYALKHGFSQATGDLIAFLDADNDLPPGQLLNLLQIMERDKADVVIGSKLHPDSKLVYPRLRRVVSLAYFSLVHFLFGLPVHDTQTGIKLFRREVLERVFPHLQIEGFAFDLELLVAAHLYGYSIAEAPVVLDFQSGSRPLDVLRAAVAMARDTFLVFYWTSFWKWLDPSLALKFWTIVLVAGLVAGSVGLGRLLNNFGTTPPFDRLFDILLLRFLDRTVRDFVLLIGGTGVLVIAAIQLNRQIVMAFSRRDRADFWSGAERPKRRE